MGAMLSGLQPCYAHAAVQSGAPWNLDRISHDDLPAPYTGTYTYPDSAGAGVTIWVLDTGVQPANTEFGGRAETATSAITGEPSTDVNGHGTALAGIAAGATYGVAKKARIVAVQILDAEGHGTEASLVAGFQYVAENKTGNDVVLLGVEFSDRAFLQDSIRAMQQLEIPVVIGAGDGSEDSCVGSPAPATEIVVAATDRGDTAAKFSNWGSCIATFAPGAGIAAPTANINDPSKDGGTKNLDGTEAAAAHAAGVIALIKADNPSSSVSVIKNMMEQAATQDAVRGVHSGTPNLLLRIPL
ncbi:S8 family serine peptidase [Nocardia sp. XZ_19_369]|uniref:S8 family serine peptidase n=1 Tax=Nocardia sp. XZ_19_369 TaxID=2769487 RepID=UPI0018909643|nr:S8 family serine peptidase [Nocardia sp. XZ_19_369]